MNAKEWKRRSAAKALRGLMWVLPKLIRLGDWLNEKQRGQRGRNYGVFTVSMPSGEDHSQVLRGTGRSCLRCKEEAVRFDVPGLEGVRLDVLCRGHLEESWDDAEKILRRVDRESRAGLN